MKQTLDELILNLDGFPDYNVTYHRNELTKMILEYKSILEWVSETSENYNLQTNSYYVHLIVIEKNLDYARYAKTEFDKDRAYIAAVNALRSDTKALAALIAPPV